MRYVIKGGFGISVWFILSAYKSDTRALLLFSKKILKKKSRTRCPHEWHALGGLKIILWRKDRSEVFRVFSRVATSRGKRKGHDTDGMPHSHGFMLQMLSFLALSSTSFIGKTVYASSCGTAEFTPLRLLDDSSPSYDPPIPPRSWFLSAFIGWTSKGYFGFCHGITIDKGSCLHFGAGARHGRHVLLTRFYAAG